MAHSVRRPRYKYAAPSLTPSCLHKLRVPAEFAARLEAVPVAGEEEEERKVLVLGPVGKVWRVELCRQNGVCWLGSGWPELAAALGIGAGWSVVLRRERRGVATLSAFDPGRCLARFCTPRAGVTCKNRPRFIKLLQPDDLEKIQLLTEAESYPSSQNAMIVCPLGKFWPVKLDHGQSDVRCGDGWAQFVTAHDLSEGNILVFRYEGNMVFSVEVFLRNGCLKEYNRTLALCTTEGTTGPSTITHRQSVKRPVAAVVNKKRKNDQQVVYAISAPVQPQSKPATILPTHSFKKKITSSCLNRYLEFLQILATMQAVKRTLCSSLDLLGPCTIQLKTSMASTRSWPVALNIKITYGFITGKGWEMFCRDNEVEEGHSCTFKVVERTVWLVVIK